MWWGAIIQNHSKLAAGQTPPKNRSRLFPTFLSSIFINSWCVPTFFAHNTWKKTQLEPILSYTVVGKVEVKLISGQASNFILNKTCRFAGSISSCLFFLFTYFHHFIVHLSARYKVNILTIHIPLGSVISSSQIM